jgi:DNA polymerase III sliding clamp (beta) subunit (PCNA family)
MKIPQNILLDVVKRLQRIKSNPRLPVLDHILVCHDRNGIHFTATDLERWLTITIPAVKPKSAIGRRLAELELIREGGSFLLPRASISQIAKAADKGTIVEIQKSGFSYTAGGSEASMPVEVDVALDAFPQEEPLINPSEPVSCDEFVKSIALGGHCTSTDDTRHSIIGMLWSEFGEAVATDGRRLFLRNGHPKIGHNITIPNATCDLLETGMVMSLAGQALFVKSEASLTIRLVSKLIDMTFPNFAQVIPPEDDFKTQVRFDAEAVRESLTKLLPKTKGTPSVLMEFHPGRVDFTIKPSKAKFSCPAVVSNDKVKSISFNPVYVTECLANRCGTLSLIDSMSPGRFHSSIHPEAFTILMPMRIESPVKAEAAPEEETEEVEEVEA